MGGDGTGAWFSRLEREDWILISATFALLVIYAVYISGYTQVPSPIFGGDLYRDRGFVNNIVSGNPVWSDGYYADELQYYPYMMFVAEAAVVRASGLSVDSVFLFFPLINLILAAWIWYALGRKLFKSRKWALLASLSFLLLVFVHSPKGASFAIYSFIPAFFLFWLKYEQENKIKDAVFAGIFLGLISLTWGGVFISTCAMFGLIVLFYYVRQSISDKRWAKNLWAYVKKYYLIALIGIA